MVCVCQILPCIWNHKLKAGYLKGMMKMGNISPVKKVALVPAQSRAGRLSLSEAMSFCLPKATKCLALAPPGHASSSSRTRWDVTLGHGRGPDWSPSYWSLLGLSVQHSRPGLGADCHPQRLPFLLGFRG